MIAIVVVVVHIIHSRLILHRLILVNSNCFTSSPLFDLDYVCVRVVLADLIVCCFNFSAGVIFRCNSMSYTMTLKAFIAF